MYPAACAAPAATMNGSATQQNIVPLSALAGRFRANIAALKTRDPKLADLIASHSPATTYSIVAQADWVRLASGDTAAATLLPSNVSPAAAKQIVQQLTDNNQLAGPLLVAGLDHGWLWDALSKLDVKTPLAPGHRTPIYLLAQDVERLWAVLHLHDWRTLLADRRCIILAGNDASSQLHDFLLAHPEIAWPRTGITTDARVWPAGQSLDSILAAANTEIERRVAAVADRLQLQQHAAPPRQQLSDKFRDGKPLRVLGITSLYTTFLQHSMRDWLAGMESLGHSTKLLIEQHDHEKPHPLIYLTAIEQFQPDLIVMIDHYRAELPLMPKHIPCVMWVQDRLPNIFSAKAGAAQGDNDFCLGFGRLELSREHGYPKSQYLSAQVGVNEKRFAPVPLTPSERERFTCDVSFVSHASKSADDLLNEQIRVADSPHAKTLLGGVFDQIKSIYTAGGRVGHVSVFKTMIRCTLDDHRLSIPDHQERWVYDFFVNKINNALFRHQTVQWLVNAGVDLHLYGNGWEQNAAFARFARGPANNVSQLSAITRASRINLQATPHGAVHQRLLDGLSSGGFFLIRYCPGDMADVLHRKLWNWVQQAGIRSHAQLVATARNDARASKLFDEYQKIAEVDLRTYAPDIYAHLELSADCEFIRSAATVWPQYSDVAFDTEQQLAERLNIYLGNDNSRHAIAAAMRQVVLERFTYAAVSRRLQGTIANYYAQPLSLKEAA